jgi:hypothetical protein
LQFLESLVPARRHIWSKRNATLKVRWDDARGSAGTPVRLHDDDSGTLILDAAFTRLGRLSSRINPKRGGLVQAIVAADEDYLDVTYLGPNDLRPNN